MDVAYTAVETLKAVRARLGNASLAVATENAAAAQIGNATGNVAEEMSQLVWSQFVERAGTMVLTQWARHRRCCCSCCGRIHEARGGGWLLLSN